MENQTVVTVEVKENNRAKKRIFVIAAILCIAAILTTGTLAFFTAEKTAFNVITTGTLEMKLVEETTDGRPFPEDGVSGVMPGQVVDKVVYVENTGNVDFYARIALEMTATASDGSALSVEHMLLDIDTENWTEKDGFYYYNSAVRPGEATEPLFRTVTFDTAMGNKYMDARFEIDVVAQTVQSRNNGNNALEASGWTDAE